MKGFSHRLLVIVVVKVFFCFYISLDHILLEMWSRSFKKQTWAGAADSHALIQQPTNRQTEMKMETDEDERKIWGGNSVRARSTQGQQITTSWEILVISNSINNVNDVSRLVMWVLWTVIS